MTVDVFLAPILSVLGVLFYLGWPRGKRWARIVLMIVVIGLLCAALVFGAYVYALGQADWSL